uniref:ribosomal protein S19 n=1 Tax=Prosopanche bonacinae TaxID=2952648 RepID=UPI002114EB23|nr:ribosomal protein S19 [Prosopanche bonacinae]USN93693.1 ribosomal protein S19 [Prosopanche bonacinae]
MVVTLVCLDLIFILNYNITIIIKNKKSKLFVHNHLIDKIHKNQKEQTKEIIKTWSRASTVIPLMVGQILAIHNGKEHIPICIQKKMIGHKLGEFVPTRTFPRHKKVDVKSKKSSYRSKKNIK